MFPEISFRILLQRKLMKLISVEERILDPFKFLLNIIYIE